MEYFDDSLYVGWELDMLTTLLSFSSYLCFDFLCALIIFFLGKFAYVKRLLFHKKQCRTLLTAVY